MSTIYLNKSNLILF